jgi:DNA-binding transcriptional LysR family regulator
VLRRVSGFEHIQFALKADSDLAQLAAIRAGFGISVCQVPLAAQNPELARVLTDEFRVDLQTWIVMHEDFRSLPRCWASFHALVDGLTSYTREAQPRSS